MHFHTAPETLQVVWHALPSHPGNTFCRVAGAFCRVACTSKPPRKHFKSCGMHFQTAPETLFVVWQALFVVWHALWQAYCRPLAIHVSVWNVVCRPSGHPRLNGRWGCLICTHCATPEVPTCARGRGPWPQGLEVRTTSLVHRGRGRHPMISRLVFGRIRDGLRVCRTGRGPVIGAPSTKPSPHHPGHRRNCESFPFEALLSAPLAWVCACSCDCVWMFWVQGTSGTVKTPSLSALWCSGAVSVRLVFCVGQRRRFVKAPCGLCAARCRGRRACRRTGFRFCGGACAGCAVFCVGLCSGRALSPPCACLCDGFASGLEQQPQRFLVVAVGRFADGRRWSGRGRGFLFDAHAACAGVFAAAWRGFVDGQGGCEFRARLRRPAGEFGAGNHGWPDASFVTRGPPTDSNGDRRPRETSAHGRCAGVRNRLSQRLTPGGFVGLGKVCRRPWGVALTMTACLTQAVRFTGSSAFADIGS